MKPCAGCGLPTTFRLTEANAAYLAWHGECLAVTRALGMTSGSTAQDHPDGGLT